MPDFFWKSGDTQPSLTDTLSYPDGTIPPLQGATLTLRLRSLASATLTTLAGTTTILNPNAGQVVFTPTAADTVAPGNYLVEWFVVFAVSTGLGQQTFPTDGYEWLFVEPNLGVLPQLIVDLGMLKRYISVPANDRTKDAELIDLIQAVTPLIEAEVGPLIPKVYEEWHDGGSNVITLKHDPSVGFGTTPLLQLIAASEYRGPIEYPLALIASPVFGSIYSTQLVQDYAAITRRTAGGRTLAFMPGRESVHVWYQAGQSPIPKNVQRATLEILRTLHRWPQQIGSGSHSPADRMEMGAAMQYEVSRIVRMWTRPARRFPSIG